MMRHVLLLGAVVWPLALLACHGSGDAPPPPASSSSTATPASSSAKQPPRTAESPHIRAKVVRFEGGKATDEALPPAIHGYGEEPKAIWASSDGDVYLVGYMYTGVPGPDTGVIYKRNKDGTWQIVWTKKENELSSIWGSGPSDIYVAGHGAVIHFDGTSWKEEPIEGLEGGVYAIGGGGPDKVYAAGGVVMSKDKQSGRIYRRQGGRWKLEAKTDGVLYGIGGTTTGRMWAVGDRGVVLGSKGDGTWARERQPSRGQLESVWAASDTDVFVAGGELLRSSGDGTWTPFPEARKLGIDTVTGRAPDDIYAGGRVGIYHVHGTALEPVLTMPDKDGPMVRLHGVARAGGRVFAAVELTARTPPPP
jgi:hypothetical protein